MYEAAEAEHRGDCNYDIVLVGSDFLEKVKLTHGSYFDTSVKRFSERSRRLALASGVTAARSISNQRRTNPALVGTICPNGRGSTTGRRRMDWHGQV